MHSPLFVLVNNALVMQNLKSTSFGVNEQMMKKETSFELAKIGKILDTNDTKNCATSIINAEEGMKSEIEIKKEIVEKYAPEKNTWKKKENFATFQEEITTENAFSLKTLLESEKYTVSLRSKTLHMNIKDSLKEKYRKLNKSQNKSILRCNSNLKNSRKKTKSKVQQQILRNILPNIYINDIPVNSSYRNITKYVASCRFCRKAFLSIEDCNNHKCSQFTKNFDKTMHKCKLCSLIFKRKNHLDKHLKAHSRNDCKVCTVQLTTRKALHKHLKNVHNIHDLQKLFKCNFCEKAFAKKQSLHSHLKEHADGKLLCLKCGFMCTCEGDFLHHMKEHAKAIKFNCALCDKQFVRRQQFDQHMMGHERHMCSPCDITFSTKKMLLKHQQSHHGVSVTTKKFECHICQKLFFRPIHLKVHLRIHTGEKPVKCSHCEKNFTNVQSLAKHMKTERHLQNVNNGKKIALLKPFLCATCGATFFHQQSLQRHIEIIHIPGETFKCPHCDYNTKCKPNMKRHMECHSNIKRYVCEICGASFRAFGTLKEHHAFVHSESRSFSCDTCHKAFKNKSSLQRHSRIHKEDRPYRCHCNRDYKRLSHLKRHLISAHHMTAKQSLDYKGTEVCEYENDSSNSSKASALAVQKDSTICNNVLDSQDQNFALGIFEGGLHNSKEDYSSLLKHSNEENKYKYVPCSLSDVQKNSQNFDFETTATNPSMSHTFVNSDSQDTASLDLNLSPKALRHSDEENNECSYLPCISDLPRNILSFDFESTTIDQSMSSSHTTVKSNSQDSATLDPNLNLSSNNFLNFSDISTSPVGNQESAHTMPLEDIIRPRSLPNLNFQPSHIEELFPFPMYNSDLPSTISPVVLLGSEVPTTCVEQNNSPKQLFGESEDILVLENFNSNSESCTAECNSEIFFSVPNNDTWNSSSFSNKMSNTFEDTEILNDSYEKASLISEFPVNLSSSFSPLLACNLVFPDDPLMECTIDTHSFNSDEFVLS